MASRTRFRPLKHVGVAKYIFLIAKSHTGHQTQTQPLKKQKMRGNTPPGFPRNSPELPGTSPGTPRNSPELPGTARNCPELPRTSRGFHASACGFCRKWCRARPRAQILQKIVSFKFPRVDFAQMARFCAHQRCPIESLCFCLYFVCFNRASGDCNCSDFERARLSREKRENCRCSINPSNPGANGRRSPEGGGYG